MSAKPKVIPSVSRERKSITDTGQMPVPYDQNRAQQSVQSNEAWTSSDSPTDENFVDDDIIEENSHVIPPTRRAAPKRGRKGRAAK